MAKQDNKNIFAKFNIRNQIRQYKQKKSIEYAKQFSEKMLNDKKQSREDFLRAMLKNAKEMNETMEDWDNIPYAEGFVPQEEDGEETIEDRADEIMREIKQIEEDKLNG